MEKKFTQIITSSPCKSDEPKSKTMHGSFMQITSSKYMPSNKFIPLNNNIPSCIKNTHSNIQATINTLLSNVGDHILKKKVM
jgi:hypothetical protein